MIFDVILEKNLFIYLRICTNSTGAKTVGHKSPPKPSIENSYDLSRASVNPGVILFMFVARVASLSFHVLKNLPLSI